MKPKEMVGLIITIIAIIILFYTFISTGGVVTGDNATLAATAGFILILLGPWLWLGEVPVAIKKFIEAKTGTKTESR
ncbi:MAG: hypothetical protein QXP68_06805 [Thermosphaera sp.]